MSTATEGVGNERQRTCAECGHLCDQSGEFHPFLFCVLKRAYPGRDPWAEFRWAVERLTGADLPARPPAVRDLPVTLKWPERACPATHDSEEDSR